MAAIPARELEFARRQREQGLLEELYTLLQTRLKEAEIADASVPTNIRVLDPALVPLRPISPSPLKNLVLAGAFGLLLGVGAGHGAGGAGHQGAHGRRGGGAFRRRARAGHHPPHPRPRTAPGPPQRRRRGRRAWRPGWSPRATRAARRARRTAPCAPT